MSLKSSWPFAYERMDGIFSQSLSLSLTCPLPLALCVRWNINGENRIEQIKSIILFWHINCSVFKPMDSAGFDKECMNGSRSVYVCVYVCLKAEIQTGSKNNNTTENWVESMLVIQWCGKTDSKAGAANAFHKSIHWKDINSFWVCIKSKRLQAVNSIAVVIAVVVSAAAAAAAVVVTFIDGRSFSFIQLPFVGFDFHMTKYYTLLGGGFHIWCGEHFWFTS